VGRPITKEIHYFDLQYELGSRWYRAHFPLAVPPMICGEATPYLLPHPLAPIRAARDLPSSTRFIVVLREPADRAISHYWSNRTKGFETESLSRALELEESRLEGQADLVGRGERSFPHMEFSYASRGEYAPQLKRWFDRLGRERFLVVESEKVWLEPDVRTEILDFLGLEPFDRPVPLTNYLPYSQGQDPEAEDQLRRHFVPHNEALFELLGREFWQSPGS
jgi:Sulfotransferase domain